MNKKDLNLSLIVFLITINLGTFVIIGYLLWQLTNTATVCDCPPALAVGTVTATPVIDHGQSTDLTYDEIANNFKSMTEAQWEDYARQITGSRVHWTVRMVDATAQGELLLNPLPDNSFFLVVEGQAIASHLLLSGLSKQEVLSINKDQLLEFEATIRGFEVQSLKLGQVLAIRLYRPTIIAVQDYKSPQEQQMEAIQATNEAIFQQNQP